MLFEVLTIGLLTCVELTEDANPNDMAITVTATVAEAITIANLLLDNRISFGLRYLIDWY